LVVTAVSVRNAPLTVARGGSVVITATMKNIGAGAAAASAMKFLLVKAGLTKNLDGTVAIPVLDSNDTKTVTTTVTVVSDTPFGTYAVQACADGLDVVREAVEDNNCLSTTETVTVQP
jgi:hypothetical protein